MCVLLYGTCHKLINWLSGCLEDSVVCRLQSCEKNQESAVIVCEQNDVLSLTLSESKAHCNHLTILLGKYESNVTAHQMSTSYADQALSAYQVLVGLLDTELALLASKCQVLGVCGYGMIYVFRVIVDLDTLF